MRTFIVSFLFFGEGLGLSASGQAQPNKPHPELGKFMLNQMCVNCHANTKAHIAPSFQTVRQARGKEWVYKFVNNPLGLAGNNIDAKKLIRKWKIIMPAYPALKKADIDAICDYVDSLRGDQPAQYPKS